MKIRIEVLECKEGHAASAWGSDSGGVSVAKGQIVVVEGHSVSMSGTDGVGVNEVADADHPV